LGFSNLPRNWPFEIFETSTTKNDTVLKDAIDNFLLSRQLQANTTEAQKNKRIVDIKRQTAG